MIQIRHGQYGRVAILDLAGSLVEHAHSHSHLLFWLDGNLEPIKVGKQTVPLDMNHAVAINSWEPHAAASASEHQRGVFLLFYLDPIWLTKHCMKLGVAPRFTSASIRLTDELVMLVQHFGTILLREQQNLDMEPYIVDLLEATFNAMLNDANVSFMSESDTFYTDFRIRKSVTYMQDHLDVRSKFEDVARAAGISRPHFFALFRKHMQMTPNVFWNTLRMETAIEKLTHTDVSLNDLSYDLGFSEPGNFSRFFRNHSGVCPSQYRLVAGGVSDVIGLSAGNALN